MAENIPGKRHHKELLAAVDEGMTVYDNEGDKLGSVKFVYLGEELETEATVAAAPLQDNPSYGELLSGIIAGTQDVPEEVAQRLMQRGFVKIGGGILSKTRYAFPDQISAVSAAEEEIHLRVGKDKLIQF